jgi:hypothetical protein
MIFSVWRRRSSVRQDAYAVVVLARGDAEVASWLIAGRGRPDLFVVDELMRLQLAAGRLGCSIRLRDACVELCELLDLVGLSDVLTVTARLPRQVGGEAEDGEQVGVKEVVMPDDPIT